MASQRQTMGQMAQSKSESAASKTVENYIYDIVSQYNGIVDKLLEATQSNGMYETKRMTSSSSISYLANVLKGLLDPAKHLMYELSTVRDQSVSTLFSMMKNMVKVIDDCPPFQKIDVRVYRNGKPNYQSFNKNLPILDFKGAITNLEAQRDAIRTALRQVYADTGYIQATIKDEDAEYRQEVFANIKEKEKNLKEALAALNQDIKEVQKRQKEGKTYPSEKWNGAKNLAESTKIKVAAANAVLPMADSLNSIPYAQVLSIIADTEDDLKEITSSIDSIVSTANKERRTLNDEENTILETMEGDTHNLLDLHNKLDKKIIVGLSDEDKKAVDTTIRRNKRKIEKLLDKFTKINEGEIKKEQSENVPAKAEEEAEAGAEAAEPGAAGAEDLAAGEEVEPVGTAAGKYGSGRYGMGMERRGIGMGKPLADLLSTKKQPQHNTMGRELSNDDKIHMEMLTQQNKWQNNIPIHYSKIGDKNPFYSQTDDTKYFFPQKLRYENSVRRPAKNAYGADVSLLQGEIGGPTEYIPMKKPTKKPEITHRTPQEALQNILNQDVYKDGMTGGYCGSGKSGALRKLVFDDENNDAFDEEELPINRGFIKEDKEDHFKLPDLKKAKRKAHAKRMARF